MKKILALLLVVGLCFALFAGCQTAENPASEAPVDPVDSVAEVDPPADEPVTLKVTTMYGEGDGNFENYNAIIEAYKAIAPNVTIERTDYHANDDTKAVVNTDFAAGNLPDVIFWFAGPPAAALMGNVVSVDEIRAVDPDYCTNILQSSIDGMKEAAHGMKTYAMPGTGFWEGLFVNEKLLEKYELTVPTTWDELINVCKVLKENGITPIAQGFADEPHYLIELMLCSGGGDDYLLVPTSAEEVPESWVTGLNGLKLLAEAGAFPDNEATLGHGDAVTMMNKGESAMIADGSWRCNIFRFTEWDDDGNLVSIAEKWDDEDIVDPEKQLARFITVIPMPAVPGGKGGDVIPGGSSTGWYITTAGFDGGAKQAAAIEFVKYMLNDENLMKLNTGIPTNGAPMEDLTRVQTDGYNLYKTARLVVPPINDRISVEAWTELWKNVAPILDDADAKDVLEAAFALNN